MTFAANAAQNEFCFDCPPEGFPDAETVAVILGGSLFMAAPGILVGIFVHRLLAGWPLVFRLAIVGGFVVVFWLWIGGARDLEDTFYMAPLFAVSASFFDGLRVNAERSLSRFSDD